MFINARVSSPGFNAEEFEKAFTAADFDRCRDLVSSAQGIGAILASARLALRERRYLDAIGMLTAAPPETSVARDVLLDRTSRERGLIDPMAVDRLLRDHAEGRTDGTDRIWTLLNLELWHRTFIDQEGIQTLPHAHSVAEIGSIAAA